MANLVTSKYEEDPIKIEGAKVPTTQNNDFPVRGRIWLKFEILWLSLLPARMKKIQ